MDMSDAKDMTMATFASSDGWKRMPATVIQRLAPCDASPMNGTSSRKKTETPSTMNDAKRHI